MKNKYVLIFIAIALCSLTGVSYGQASSTTAELRGKVVDSSGVIIQGGTVTLTDVVKGSVRVTTSGIEGGYTFINLLPSKYMLRAEAAGFNTVILHFDLTVGIQAEIPIKMSVIETSTSVDVSSNIETFSTTGSHQSSIIEARQINNLPIGRRNYLDYTLLTPGVTDTDTISDTSDFRVAQTPQSGLSFGGGNGRGNMIFVDGGEAGSSAGGFTDTLSQEAVQEFQVMRNSYSAEFGNASGGVISIISKSGGITHHGSVFGFFRDQSFDAKNSFDFKPNGKSKFNRQQFGGSVGGPILKDKTFYFAAFERYRKNETTFVNLLKDPNIFNINQNSNNPLILQQTALFDYLSSSEASTEVKAIASALRNSLTTTNYADTVKLFTNSSGQFPFKGYQTNFMFRGDHKFSDNKYGYVRFYINRADEENSAAGALTAVSRGRSTDIFNHGVIASFNNNFSQSFSNEVTFQYTYTRLDNSPNEKYGPELNIEGYGNFNRDIFLPGRTQDIHYDISDNLSKIVGSHTLKMGGSVWVWDVNTRSSTYFGGRFNFGNAIPLTSLLGNDPATNPFNQYLLSSGSSYKDLNKNGVADIFESPMTSLQSFNLGLPIIYQQGFGKGDAQSYSVKSGFYAQDMWKARTNLTINYGVRYQINDNPFYVPTQYKDIQPRVGFSWKPMSDGKTVIRGGAGIYTGFVNNAVANVTNQLAGFGFPHEINTVLTTATSNALGVPTSMAVYQSLKSRGILGNREVTAADLAALGIIPEANNPLEVRFRIADNYKNPSSYQASFGIQRELGKGVSLETSYLFSRGIHLTRNRDINQIKRTGFVNPLNPEGGATFIRIPTAAHRAASLTSDFANPLRLQDNEYESTADSFYHAFTAEVTKRFSKRIGLNAHYTFSKAIDEVTDYNSDFSAQNPLNVNADRALSSFDQRHRAVFTAELESPFQNMVVRNWRIVPIFIVSSGRPFNLLLGFDANGDGRSQSDRPGQAGRNTGIGEKYVSMDLRVARGFIMKETRSLEFTFEAFNLFNRVNMLGINNIVGTSLIGVSDFNLRGRRDRTPTEALGFTTAADARKLQLGLRFIF